MAGTSRAAGMDKMVIGTDRRVARTNLNLTFLNDHFSNMNFQNLCYQGLLFLFELDFVVALT